MRSDKQATPFLFASPDRRAPSSSARRVHLRRLYDILHLSIQRGDLPLARRAFGLLARCEDVEWPDIWKFGLVLLAPNPAAEDEDAPTPGGDVGTQKHIEFLQVMMLRHPEQRESLVRELVLSLAMAGRERDALDELELYLPSPPYQDNSVLHTYAGLLCLRLAQSTMDTNASRSSQGTLLREAQQHLERARALDPEGVVAPAFIRRVRRLS
ncbi:hypothetical protein BJV77DRAFT_939661 [Russula vinacea]|nr:hypothetical protein BJV77DRAFT_939661 [Russula vinacea]